MNYGFGVDLGGTTVKLAYFDQEGTLLDKWEIPTNLEDKGGKILPDIASSILDYLKAHHIDKASILGVGIGVPALWTATAWSISASTWAGACSTSQKPCPSWWACP